MIRRRVCARNDITQSATKAPFLSIFLARNIVLCDVLYRLGAPDKGQSTIRALYSLGAVFEGRKGTGGNLSGAQTSGRYAVGRESAGSVGLQDARAGGRADAEGGKATR